MNTTTLDTLSAARSLEAAGIEAKQAEAIVQPPVEPSGLRSSWKCVYSPQSIFDAGDAVSGPCSPDRSMQP